MEALIVPPNGVQASMEQLSAIESERVERITELVGEFEFVSSPQCVFYAKKRILPLEPRTIYAISDPAIDGLAGLFFEGTVEHFSDSFFSLYGHENPEAEIIAWCESEGHKLKIGTSQPNETATIMLRSQKLLLDERIVDGTMVVIEMASGGLMQMVSDAYRYNWGKKHGNQYKV